MIRVDHLDSKTKTIYTAQQTVYGFMTGADWRRWYALNLLEELDLPGEYVIDKENEKCMSICRQTPGHCMSP